MRWPWAKDALRTYFRQRESERASEVIGGWKSENAYPYKERPQGVLEEAEKDVFDICALTVYEYLPDFQKWDSRSRRLTFRLMQEALKSSPSSIKKILSEVLALRPEQQDELASILEKTTMSAILNAAKIVADRLAFLEGINEMLFGEFKKSLNERTQLQRILVEELWIFGEQYSLGVDDESLKSLLKKHLELLGRDDFCIDHEGEPTDVDGRIRILDLMLYRRFPQSTPDHHEHLIIELKRPIARISESNLSQIKHYAFAVEKDPRFDKAKTKWTFVLIGNDFTEYTERECNNSSRAYGHIYSSSTGNLNIYVKKWASLLSDVKWRYDFFRSKLEYEASVSDGVEYLRKRHGQYLPDDTSIT